MILIRRMTLDDIPAVAVMEKETFTDPWSEKVYRETLAIEDVVYLVAVDDEKVVSVTENTELNNGSYLIVGACGIRNIVGEGEITNVMVKPQYRNRGVAAQMLSKLLEEGTNLGASDFTLEVRASNASAIHLYEKIGFVTEGVRKDFYDHPKEDALIMWKRKAVE